ncbi:MAG: ribonuclease Z [Prolixibacteraceae bacterium]|jgi:ribonuclease Z|nr:ribonuclease Z [Prolixibacteraceae bacterium]NLX28815.1 ribonuclease Z [Bacteroidales bacterium]HPJ77420.1 ribonuclease Z [Prolixibacteraceae bacterium]HRV88253.1 ribonuclease Z [Prolixibacteraceae bacterium]
MTFEVTILGSSSAIPTSERYPTAQAVNLLGRFFLVDCGEGTQIQLRRMKFSFARVNHIFVSHLHGDHFLGLPGLISTRNLLGIKSDLHIYAHSPLKELIQPLIDHMKGELGFSITFHPLNFRQPAVVWEDRLVEVVSFPLKHSVPCCGFLFREKPSLPNLRKDQIARYAIPVSQMQQIKEGAGFTTGEGAEIPHSELVIAPPAPRSYAFMTDTAYHEPAAEIIRGADLLYHEATFLEEMQDWAGKTLHSTARQAAQMAVHAGVGRLILGHFSTRYKNLSPFLTEARALFPETSLAADGDRFAIPTLPRRNACQN